MRVVVDGREGMCRRRRGATAGAAKFLLQLTPPFPSSFFCPRALSFSPFTMDVNVGLSPPSSGGRSPEDRDRDRDLTEQDGDEPKAKKQRRKSQVTEKKHPCDWPGCDKGKLAGDSAALKLTAES
jgi:hypothetical protein